jgi:hypothetical protein
MIRVPFWRVAPYADFGLGITREKAAVYMALEDVTEDASRFAIDFNLHAGLRVHPLSFLFAEGGYIYRRELTEEPYSAQGFNFSLGFNFGG